MKFLLIFVALFLTVAWYGQAPPVQAQTLGGNDDNIRDPATAVPLRLTLGEVKSSSSGKSKAATEFRVSFENVGDRDTVLNLGMMLANGRVQMPNAVRIVVQDPEGRRMEMRYFDPKYPGVGGRVDDYVVPLRSGATYSLRLKLTHYVDAKALRTPLDLAPGNYSIWAEFDGARAQYASSDVEGRKLLPYWTGRVTSKRILFIVSASE